MKPRFMALRALGRSRVMTATPLGWTLPFTKSSPAAEAAAMIAKLRIERGERFRKPLSLGIRVAEVRNSLDDLVRSWEAAPRIMIFVSFL